MLYLALDDSLPGIQDRLKAFELPGSKRFYISTLDPEWFEGNIVLPTTKGLDRQIERWILSVPNPVSVYIDCYAAVMDKAGKSSALFESDYKDLVPLKLLASKYRMPICLLHHTNKAEMKGKRDIQDLISGTMGVSAVVDNVMILTRDRLSSEGRLWIHGKRIEEMCLALKFDPKTQGAPWILLGNAGARTQGARQNEVLNYLEENGAASIKDIEKALSISYENVRKTLSRLKQSGLIEKIGGNLYTLPTRAVSYTHLTLPTN